MRRRAAFYTDVPPRGGGAAQGTGVWLPRDGAAQGADSQAARARVAQASAGGKRGGPATHNIRYGLVTPWSGQSGYPYDTC